MISAKSRPAGSNAGNARFFGRRLAPALVHAAIDREADPPGVDHEAGAGHFARRAEEADLHGAILTVAAGRRAFPRH